MPECDQCGREEILPFTCAYCGGNYCAEHKLPENHNCAYRPKAPPPYLTAYDNKQPEKPTFAEKPTMKRALEVKKPKVKFVRPKKDYVKHAVVIIIHEYDSVIEDLSSHIRRGFNQKADIVAIEVNHLERRPITGFNAKWLGQSVNLEKALNNAIAYEKKGIVLLFKCRREGYRVRVLRCKKA